MATVAKHTALRLTTYCDGGDSWRPGGTGLEPITISNAGTLSLTYGIAANS